MTEFILAKSASYTVTTGDDGAVLLMDTSGGALTVTLPSASGVSNGFRVGIVKANAGPNRVSVVTAGADGIGGNGPSFAVTGAANNGAGLIRLTIAEQRVLRTGARVRVAGVGGVPAANGDWTVTSVSFTKIDLQGSTFSGSYTSGGTATALRTKVDLRTQGALIDLVSDGVSQWWPLSGAENFLYRDYALGPNVGYPGFSISNSRTVPVDFLYDSAALRLHARTIMLSEVNDPSEVALRRTGGTYPDGPVDYVPANTAIGTIHWTAMAATSSPSFQSRSAQIYARLRETATQNGGGGQLVFGTMPLGGTALSDRMLIDHNGRVNIGGTSPGSYVSEGRFNVQTDLNEDAAYAAVRNNSATGNVLRLETFSASGGYFVYCRSDVDNSTDTEFAVSFTGAVSSDSGTSMSSPADYAEMIAEWWDGNPSGEDRVGRTVVLVHRDAPYLPLVGNNDAPECLLRLADTLPSPIPPDAIIGVVSGNPTIKGRSYWNRWQGKYETDPFGRVIEELVDTVSWDTVEYEEMTTPRTGEAPALNAKPAHFDYEVDRLPVGVVPPPDAIRGVKRRPILSPGFDPARPYVPREERPEWDYVGLLGQIAILDGQPVHPRWLRLRRLAPGVSEWLVR